MSLSNIGKNGVNEFFEDLTYNVAYTEVLGTLKNVIGLDGKDSSVVKEALESSLNIMVSSALFLYIQKQEMWINKIIVIVGGIVTLMIGKFATSLARSKLGKLVGRKLKIVSNLFGSTRSDSINTARLAVEYGNLVSSKNQSVQTSGTVFSSVAQKEQTILNQESHNLNIARAKVQSINETLLFKLFTKNFTQSDIEMINRICGNKTNGNITKEQLNQVADFMYITDDKGQITGLSEQFLTMLNGLGYMHNKTKKS